jgi:hypothetical protein
MNEEINKLLLLKPFYVYALHDENDHDFFYIGKGQDARLFQHAKEARRRKSEKEKDKKILEIEQSGHKVKQTVVGRFDSDSEAFAVESTLIHWVYGIDSLTNVASGHGANQIRPKNNFAYISTLQENIFKPYYVYALINDIKHSIFYIGQGKGNRAYQHLKEVERGIIKTRKQNEIFEIIKAGGNYTPIVIGRFNTKKEALAVESILIHWVYGIDSLKNDVSGHKVTTIRPKNHYEELQGIDEPELNYCARTKANRERNDIVGFLNEIRTLIESKCNIKFDDIHTHNDRCTYLVKFIKGVRLTVVSHHTARRAAAVTIESIDTKEINKARVRHVCDNSKLEWKDNGRYGRIMPAGSFTDPAIVLQKFTETLSEIEKIKI